MIKNVHEVKDCPDCASDNIVYDDSRDQIICRDCGLIYEPLIPTENEKFLAARRAHAGTPSSAKPAKPATKARTKAAKKKNAKRKAAKKKATKKAVKKKAAKKARKKPVKKKPAKKKRSWW